MDIFWRKFSLHKFSPTKWINHPVYFIFCLAIGFYLWSFSFANKKILNESIQLSSFAENLAELRKNETETINRLPAEKSPKKQLPKRFKANPAFQFFELIENLVNEN